MSDLAVIINSYNRKPLLEAALQTLFEALGRVPEAWVVIVFEAGSTDGSREYLNQEVLRRPPGALQVVMADATEDTGFSSGVNEAWQHAIRRHPKLRWLLLYETDNQIESSQPLRHGLQLLRQQTNLGAVGFTVRKGDGSPAGYGCPFPTGWHFILGPQFSCRLGFDRPRVKQAGEVEGSAWWFCDVVYSSPILIRRECWEQSGGFDARYFPFADCDVDWAWRANKLGWRQAVIQTRAVIHDNQARLSNWSANRALRFHQARFAYLARTRGRAAHLLKPALWVRHLFEFGALSCVAGLRPSLRPLAKQKWDLMRSVWRGYEPKSPQNNRRLT